MFKIFFVLKKFLISFSFFVSTVKNQSYAFWKLWAYMIGLKWEEENKAKIYIIEAIVTSTSLWLLTSQVWESFLFLCPLDILKIGNLITYSFERSKSSKNGSVVLSLRITCVMIPLKKNQMYLQLLCFQMCSSLYMISRKINCRNHCYESDFLFFFLSWCHLEVYLWLCVEGWKQLQPWTRDGWVYSVCLGWMTA